MSSENSVSELEAKFDAILDRVIRRRGQQRQKHVAELKQLFIGNTRPLRTEETRRLIQEKQNIKTKLAALEKKLIRSEGKLKLTNQSWKIVQDACRKAERKVEQLDKDLKETTATLHKKEHILKTMKLLLDS